MSFLNGMDPDEADLAEALLSGDRADQDRALDRVTLRAAVRRQITCRYTGNVMDVSRSVLIHFKGDDDGQQVMDAIVWDKCADMLRKGLSEKGYTITQVLDGRELFA